MATIIANGCFDFVHKGHQYFLLAAKYLGRSMQLESFNHLVVCVNSDESARRLKSAKWGTKYPIDSLPKRVKKLMHFADEVWSFDTEEQLYEMIKKSMPCIIVKGPDYAGKRVTGDDIAPVIILDTPEPESVKRRKVVLYGQEANQANNQNITSR